MSKKDEFIAAAQRKRVLGMALPRSKEDVNLKAFTDALNADPELRHLFREAVEEAAGSPEDQAAVGLASLFGGQQ